MAITESFGMPQPKRRRAPKTLTALKRSATKKRGASALGDMMVNIDLPQDNMPYIQDGTLYTPLPNGDVIYEDVAPQRAPAEKLRHDTNLAEHMSEMDLDFIADDVLTGIQDDDTSRGDWLENYTKGMDLLGLKIENARSGSANAPVEGQSTFRHPLLLEAVQRGKANARGELLPAAGPVKVRIDGDDEQDVLDPMARVLQRDMNHYLTTVATEYYDDTDRMLFWTFFGGSGFKKVYWCPIRRRPVSESVDAKDFIVSNNATDINNAARRTHVISMRPSIMKRMQLLEVYRDIDLAPPPLPQSDPITQKTDMIQGITKPQRAEDTDFELYECYCELDLPGFQHKYEKGKRKGKPSGLALPYRVTIEKNSRKILEIRRNWEEGDTDYMAKNPFVHYMFDTGLGLYGMGLVSILGNTTNALTAIWREIIDAGMFANFPGFLYAKDAGTRNASNQFRVAPGSGVPIETGGKPLNQVVMALPYKSADAGFVQSAELIASTGARLGGTSEAQVGEGTPEAKTGAMLALIEQASKMMSAVHKRLHAAQAQEFRKLRDEFVKDPSALWRGNKRASKFWDVEKARAALDEYALVPVADPNEPTELHRALKAQAVHSISTVPTAQGRYDLNKVDAYVMRMIGVPNPQAFFVPPAPPQPDPKVELKKAEVAVKQGELALKGKDLEVKALLGATDAQIKREQMISDENVEALRIVERLVTNPESDAVADQELIDMANFLHPTAINTQPVPMPPPMAAPPMPPAGPAPMPPQMPQGPM